MALIIKDRVQETSNTTGTGTLTLNGAVTGFQSFASAIGNGNTTYYGIYANGYSDWEVGVGTVSYTGGVGYLARTTVLASSNAGSLVNFTEAQLSVWGDMPAIKGMYLDTAGKATSYTLSLPTVSDTMQYTPNSSTPSLSKGLVWYDNNNDSLVYYNNDQEVQIGKQTVFRAYNQTGSTIAAGQIVYVNGTYIGQYPTIALAQANSLSTSVVIGVTSESISNNSQGYVIINGIVNGVNTSSYSAGADLFLSATTPGALTSTAPSNPNYSVQIGICISANTSGSLLIVPEYLSVPASNVVGTLSNSQLANSAITINGISTSLGGSINVGTITSISGTTNQITASTTSGATTLSLPSTVTTGAFVANETTTGSLNAGAFSYGTLGYSDINILASFSSSVNTYNQIVLQNKNSGATASTNYNVSNDSSTSTTNFGEFGINSSGFTGSGFSTAGWTYLASASTDIAIGTYGANAIHFIVGSGSDSATVNGSTGVWTFASTITGSISGNAGTVTNGIYTTGSYASPSWLTSISGSIISGGTINGGSF